MPLLRLQVCRWGFRSKYQYWPYVNFYRQATQYQIRPLIFPVLGGEAVDTGAKILVTTAKKPPIHVRRLVIDLVQLLPRCQKINRGRMNSSELVDKAIRLGFNRLLTITSAGGNPRTISGFILDQTDGAGHSSWLFDLKIHNVITRNELNQSFPDLKNELRPLTLECTSLPKPIKEAFHAFFVLPIRMPDSSEVLQIYFARPGFRFKAFGYKGKVLPPSFSIDEILLVDPRLFGDRNSGHPTG